LSTSPNFSQLNSTFRVINANKRAVWVQLLDEENKEIAAKQKEKKIDMSNIEIPHEIYNMQVEPMIENENDYFAIVYCYGSIVFFNTKESVQKQWLHTLRHKLKDQGNIIQNLTADINEDELVVVVDPTLSQWSRQSNNLFFVKVMDLNNANVISHMLAKSVAMESYEAEVLSILENFKSVNNEIQQLNKVTRNLTPVIAQGNALRCDLFLSVRIFDTYVLFGCKIFFI